MKEVFPKWISLKTRAPLIEAPYLCYVQYPPDVVRRDGLPFGPRYRVKRWYLVNTYKHGHKKVCGYFTHGDIGYAGRITHWAELRPPKNGILKWIRKKLKV